ncbi:Akr1a1 [Symbiodinium natans]|uniref:Akr1a1 protein n=1 Tax=Symbiodinium natans TaxID=878477 RepID=A0A812Q8G3_9DINO|nr:Akr1a1 [Symbiodinium natans]
MDSPLGSWRELSAHEDPVSAGEDALVGRVFTLGSSDDIEAKEPFPGARGSPQRQHEMSIASFGCTTGRDVECTMLRIEEQLREGLSRSEEMGERMLRKQADVQSSMSKRLDELSARPAQISTEELGRFLADATIRSVDSVLRQFEARIESRLARQEEALQKQQTLNNAQLEQLLSQDGMKLAPLLEDSSTSLVRFLNDGLSAVTDRFEKSSESLRKTVQADLATINGRCEIMTDAVHECNRSQVQAQEELRHFLRRFQQELQFLQPAQDVPVDVSPELQELRGSVEGGFNHLSDRMLILRQELMEVYSIVADLGACREKSFYEAVGRQSRESLLAERSRHHSSEIQCNSAPQPSLPQSKPASRRSSTPTSRPQSGGAAPTEVPAPECEVAADEVAPEAAGSCVREALRIGYSHLGHIDSAYIYWNEAEVGKALSTSVGSGQEVSREELFVTSKLWNTHHDPSLVETACKSSLQKMGLDYFDLYLLHHPYAFSPQPPGGNDFPLDPDGFPAFADIPLTDTWAAMEALVSKGLVRSIGVSNCDAAQLTTILDSCSIRPSVNQVECHPYTDQSSLQAFCREHGILLTAFSALGSADSPWRQPGAHLVPKDPHLLSDPVVCNIASSIGKTPAQVLLRYNIQLGNAVITKSIHPDRLASNFEALAGSWELSEEHMAELRGLGASRAYQFGHVPCSTERPASCVYDWDELVRRGCHWLFMSPKAYAGQHGKVKDYLDLHHHQ